MLSKIFKKDDVPTAAELEAEAAATNNAAHAADKAEWEQKLAAAGSDEVALLAVAIASPVVDVKVAAVSALTSEEALKSAEKEFRTHDRRVYRIAKQRYETCVAERGVRSVAATLIASAASLEAEAHIPANRLVELDHAWQVLDQTLISDEQKTDYANRVAKITAIMRERGDQQLALSRWCSDAETAQDALATICADVITGAKTRAELAVTAQQALATLTAKPTTDAGFTVTGKAKSMKDVQLLAEQLEGAFAMSAQVDTRLGILDELTSRSDANAAAARWRALAPIDDMAVSDALNARFHEWERHQADALTAKKTEHRDHIKAEKKAEKDAKTEQLVAIVSTAEASLAAGQLAETNKHLVALDEAESQVRATGSLRVRIDALQAEYARLKGWQHWGGGRVRDDVVAEAEALAAEVAVENAKLNIKAHADAIEKLRERWKELDKLGGATSRALWQRFDAALKTAYAPVNVQVAKLKAQRSENLDARNKLVTALNAAPMAEPPDFKELARTVEHFQVEWRKLGPVEHTVPKKAQEGLLTRMRAAVARLEVPLTEARRVAHLKREKLIADAKALATNAQSRDTVAKVRELQNEWQVQAKALPLARNQENALWKDFKAASDSIFTARDAVFSARDAEFKGNQDAREALIARLDALQGDVAAEYKRTIADVDTAWRRAGEAPKAVAAKLDARFRGARESAQKRMLGIANRVWYGTCDALSAKIALCEEIEASSNKEGAQERYTALGALPAKWEAALGARLKAALDGKSTSNADALNNALLQLEIVLDIEPPVQFQAARREFKLRAMKAALEGRGAAGSGDVEQLLGDAIAHAHADAGARDRLRAIVSTVRTNGKPGK